MPPHRLGRLIDHLHLRVADLEASRRFYRTALGALGRELTADEPDHFAADELYVDRADGPASRVHLAFQAADREAVRAFHEAALAAGGRDNGGPGERAYGPNYYAAFALDPDGNNVEAVHHGPARRLAPLPWWSRRRGERVHEQMGECVQDEWPTGAGHHAPLRGWLVVLGPGSPSTMLAHRCSRPGKGSRSASIRPTPFPGRVKRT